MSSPEPQSITITMLVADQQIDRRVLDQARTLILTGCRVTVIAGPKPPGNRDEAVYPDVPIVRMRADYRPEDYAMDDPRLPEALRKNFGAVFDTHTQMLELALQHEAQIYTAHDLPQLPAAAIAAQCNSAFLVYDAHEFFPERQFFPPATIYSLQEVERSLLPLVDHAITVNQSIAELMAVRYGIDVPSVVLNCPAVHDDQLPDGSADLLRQSLGLPADRPVLLFQGNLNANRNLDALVRAMSGVQDERTALVFMGGGPLRESLETLAEELGLLGSRVFFHAAVPQDELLAYTASADGGIIPYPHVDLNTYFCTPNKLFEFIVSGLPILSNDSPELNRYVGRQGVGLNHPMRSPQDIAAAIDAFFAGDLAGWRATAQGLRERYTWEHEQHTFMAAYGSIVGTYAKATLFQTVCNGRQAFEQGRPEEATQWAQSVLELAPNYVPAFTLLMDIAFAAQDMVQTLRMAKQVLELEPAHEHARNRITLVQQYDRNLAFLDAHAAA